MFSIKITDKSGMHIGDRINVDISEITKYLNKGFVVIDISTGYPINMDYVYNTVGVSDGLILENDL